VCEQSAEFLVLKYQAVSIITTGFYKFSRREECACLTYVSRKVSDKCSAGVFRIYGYHVRFTQVKSYIRTLEVCYEITFALNLHAFDFKNLLNTAEK